MGGGIFLCFVFSTKSHYHVFQISDLLFQLLFVVSRGFKCFFQVLPTGDMLYVFRQPNFTFLSKSKCIQNFGQAGTGQEVKLLIFTIFNLRSPILRRS
jgi:hypothetical protein